MNPPFSLASSANKPSFTIDQAAEQITRFGPTWNGMFVTNTSATVTYAFRATAPATMPYDTGGFSQLTGAQMAAAELSLQAWADVANITFVRVNPGGYSDNAQMLFGNFSSGLPGTGALGFSPGSNPQNGDVWIKTTYAFNMDPYLLGFGRNLLLHEIGHTLGLAHPGSYDVTKGSDWSYAADAPYFEDSYQYTVMSYWSETDTGADFHGYYSAGPMIHDIAAIQRLYGANMTTRTGDTVYGFNSNSGRDHYSISSAADAVIFAVWDAGGTDTLDFSLYADAQLISLVAESFSNVGGLVGNVSIARGAVIENAIGGSGNDTLIGNAASNVLIGGAGDDILFADAANGFDNGATVDHLYGGAGNDFIFSGYGDIVDGGEGAAA